MQPVASRAIVAISRAKRAFCGDFMVVQLTADECECKDEDEDLGFG